MRKRITVLLTLALVIATVAGVSAQLGSDSVTHNTSWTFQNLGESTAEVTVDLYDTTGEAIVDDESFNVEASASFWAPDYTPLGDATFNGSLVAMSSEPLASISNQVAANATSGKSGNATYMGFTNDNVAPTMYAPVVMKSFAGLYWTELSIQSAGGDTTVTVTYYDQTGAEEASSTHEVKAGSPVRVAQEDEAGLPADFNGSVVVASQDGTTPLALVVNEFVGSGNGMYNQFYSYEGFAEGSTRVVLPAVFINGYGGTYQASTSVQNLSGPTPAANVTWYFYDVDAADPTTAVYSYTESIATSKSVYFPSADYADTLTGADGEWVGTVVLESDQPLIAIVNELAGGYWAASYTGLAEGADELYFPLAFVNGYGFAQTSFSIADLSDTPGGDVSVTVEYIADKTGCPGCSDQSVPYTFQNTDSKYQPDHVPAAALSDGTFIGSIRITSNKPIGGIMNEIIGAFDQDSFTSFNAFVAP